MTPNFLNVFGLFVMLAGFVIGLGAVTVIDLHGFLGRNSAYWTEATTRTHKVTKPLIWIGMFLAVVGGFIFYRNYGLEKTILIHLISACLMIINGIFLSFSVSPFLLQREREGKSSELLPKSWQVKITFSFIVSFVLWWGNLFLLVSNVVPTEVPEETPLVVPLDLGTKYIHTVEWPPTYTVSGGEPVCVESGSEIKEGGITKKVIMGKNEYCVTEMSEGAAGSTYTTYTYLANLNASTLTLKFTLKFSQCYNYDEPQKSECLSERTKFDINKIIDDIYNGIDKA